MRSMKPQTAEIISLSLSQHIQICNNQPELRTRRRPQESIGTRLAGCAAVPAALVPPDQTRPDQTPHSPHPSLTWRYSALERCADRSEGVAFASRVSCVAHLIATRARSPFNIENYCEGILHKRLRSDCARRLWVCVSRV